MSTELVILKQENIGTIVSAAPQSYIDNRTSRDKCIAAGQNILDEIERTGMTDELDEKAKCFIDKARRTVKSMNDRRSPVTKLFDDIRKEFTSLENAIDPLKADTVAYKLQQFRNRYAAKKREEEEERQRQELARKQAEAARAKMCQDIEADFRQQFMNLSDSACNALNEIDGNVTLENYEQSFKTIKEYPDTLPEEWLADLKTLIRVPYGIQVSELKQVEDETGERLSKQFIEQYQFEVSSTKEYILDRLPSKKANLERIAKADAEEAARLQAEMEERQRKEAADKEAERIKRETEEKRKAELEQQKAEMESLFDNQAVVQGYQPKVNVTKKIELLNPEGILAVLSMWWMKEGSTLTTDELAKMFKKQMTFCEKLAKEGTFIEDESVNYIDDVKAK